jgi:hypothetical protein
MFYDKVKKKRKKPAGSVIDDLKRLREKEHEEIQKGTGKSVERGDAGRSRGNNQ